MSAEKIITDCVPIHHEYLEIASRGMIERRALEKLANLYKAFSDPTRIRILWALKCHPLCVNDLAVVLNMTKSAVSHQLKFLRLSNLVRFNRDGKLAYYSLADDHVAEILTFGLDHISEDSI